MATQTIVPESISTVKGATKEFHIAQFEYHEGIHYAREHGLLMGSSFDHIMNFNKFIVVNGKVLLQIESTDFSDIQRKAL